MKSTSRWFGLFLVSLAVFTTARVCAQDRDDRDRDDRDRRGGACFYIDAQFRGDKLCLEAGERMAQLPPNFTKQISSIRIFGGAEINVYQDRDFGGPSLHLRDDVANLQSYQVRPGHSWNDRISSIEVFRTRDYSDRDHDRDRDHYVDRDHGRDRDHDGAWDREPDRGGACFFTSTDFRGDKFCVERGDRIQQVPPGFNDNISSIRLYGRVTVTVYQDANFGGPSLRVQDDVSNLQSYQVKPGHSWNDRISSLQVY